MKRRSSLQAFTLIEMVTVIAIIAILAGLVLSVNALAQRKAANARAKTEIMALSSACESYKTDMGGYPQDPNTTDKLDPRISYVPTNYQKASQFLYGALSGDDGSGGGTAFNGKIDAGETPRNYLPDFWKPTHFNSDFRTSGTVLYICDPFGYSYGYSTAGLNADQTYRTQLLTNPGASRPAGVGYNTTFDIWSTGGGSSAAGSPSDLAKWLKNW